MAAVFLKTYTISYKYTVKSLRCKVHTQMHSLYYYTHFYRLMRGFNVVLGTNSPLLHPRVSFYVVYGETSRLIAD
jgi:hypothetical protein